MRIDLHRHLGGSIRPQFVWDIIQKNNLSYLGESLQDVIKEMTFVEGEPYGFHRFLNKFRILDAIKWNEDLLEASIKDVCDGLEEDNIDYTWLRFSINKYIEHIDKHKWELIKLVSEMFKKYRPNKVGLMLSLKYESMKASQRQYAKLIENPEVADALIGIDLVGDEANFDCEFYKPIFDDWKSYKKILCAHVGESQSVNNILDAITDLGVDHIAHGIKIIDRMDIMKIAKDNNICFDLAISSNYYTGVASKKLMHPIRTMFNEGLLVTVGTDDPTQCSTTLDKEFEILKKLRFTDAEISKIKQTAIDRVRHYGLIR